MVATMKQGSRATSESMYWAGAVALLAGFALLTELQGIGTPGMLHWVAYQLINGNMDQNTAIIAIMGTLPWWVMASISSAQLIPVLTWWTSFVIAFGWEGLGVAVAAISWTGVGGVVLAALGAGFLG